jgi:hypothetical protein
VETVWAWDGTRWELLDGDGPPATVVTGMAWDDDRDVLVRYGGIPLPSQSCDPATWEWSLEGGWREIDAEPPVPCDHVELTADPSADRLLMVGGGRGPEPLAGTWAWDGAAWTAVADAGPPPRGHHGLVTDAADGTAIVFGGYDGLRVFDDLWAWDGSAWEEVEVTGAAPGPRSHHGFAIGPEAVLMVGGATTTSTFRSLVADTWLLADGGWSRVAGAGPSARGLPALGYDPTRDVFVLHGGFDASGAALADTWEWDGAWRCLAGCR